MDATTFAAFIDEPGVQLVDVRTAAEYLDGHLPGAQLMDIYAPTFADEVSRLSLDHPVAVYCRSGMRSQAAAEYMRTLGYQVEELSVGIMGWNGSIVKGL